MTGSSPAPAQAAARTTHGPLLRRAAAGLAAMLLLGVVHPGAVAAAPPAVPGLGGVAADAGPTSGGMTCSTTFTEANLRTCWEQMMGPLERTYRPLVTGLGRAWAPPSLVIFGQIPPENPCVDLQNSDVLGSFYCDRNQTIYMSTFQADAVTVDYVRAAGRVPGVLAADARRARVALSRLRRGYATRGQVAILAHEYAHHVQSLTGVQQWYDERAAKHEAGSSRADRYFFTTETAADCLTGYTLGRAARTREIRSNAFELWAARAFFAQSTPFSIERPESSPFKYDNQWRGRIYRGYGGAYWRLRAFNYGLKVGRANGDGLGKCVRTAAKWKKVGTPRSLLG